MNSEHPDELVREAAYRAYLLPDKDQENVLRQLLSSRHQLAKLAGFSSYAGNHSDQYICKSLM